MSGIGLQLALKRTLSGKVRLYEVVESERFGAYAKVLRGSDGRIHEFDDEEAARSFIGEMPDATEADYPE
jgi:hypothetical protein